MLKLIKNLGIKSIGASQRRVSVGIYECPTCHSHIERVVAEVKHRKTSKCIECQRKTITKHGSSRTRLFNTWAKMLQRCNNHNDPAYELYGGRGVDVCEEWLEFANFKHWATNNGYADELSIDRIDSNGNYEPTNCRWANIDIQNENRGLFKTNNSGYKGVSFVKQNKKWKSTICVHGRNVHLGYFDDALDAAIAYDKFIERSMLDRPTNNALGLI